MGYTCDALIACCKNHQLLYQIKNATLLHLTYMWNYLKELQVLGAHITSMQFMELNEEMKHLKSKYQSKLTKPLDDVKLCAILLHIIPQHWSPLTGSREEK